LQKGLSVVRAAAESLGLHGLEILPVPCSRNRIGCRDSLPKHTIEALDQRMEERTTG
jgi:hypothetical protein